MKLPLKIFLASLFFVPLIAAAAQTPTTVTRDTTAGLIRPSIITDYIKAQFFTATSTTNKSTFPYASTTVTSATRFCLIGDICISTWPTGGVGGDPFTHPAAGQSATTSLMLFNGNASTTLLSTGGLYLKGAPVATTSLVVCLQGPPTCEFTDPADAVRALPSTGGVVHIKTGTYTGLKPLVIPTGYDNVIIEGEGVGTVLRWSRFTYPGAYIHSEGTDQKQNIVVRDLQLSQFNSEGASTCVDFGGFADSWFQNLEMRNCYVHIMASTSAFQNHFQGIEIHNGTAASSGVSVYGGANDNIFTDISVSNVSDVAKGFYFNAHSNKCYLCDVEAFAKYGLYLGPNADDFIGDMYLELNQTNAYISPGTETVNLQGTYESASTTNGVQQNIVNGGATGLRANVWQEFLNKSYFSGDYYGFNTTNPIALLDVSNADFLAGGNTVGLFGGRGSAIGLNYKSGASQSGRYLVNTSVSTSFPSLDFVVATDTESGVRLVRANTIGTNDVLVQPEVQGTGWAIFEGRSSTTISASTGGTAISSQLSPVVLAPERNPLLYANIDRNVSIGTSSGSGRLTVWGKDQLAASKSFIVTDSASTTIFAIGNTGSTTATNGFDISDGCYAVDGVCIGAGSGSGIVGSGTTGQMPYYAGSGTTLTATSSLLIGTNQSVTAAGLMRAAKFGVGSNATNNEAFGVVLDGTLLTTGTRISSDVSTRNLLSGFVTGDAQIRTTLRTDGLLTIGDGTTPGDTNIFRNAANVLRTNDNFVADFSGAFGTTTIGFLGQLSVSSSSDAQLALLSGVNSNAWVMRNQADGGLWVGTSTLSGATSTAPALNIDSNGKVKANCFTVDGTTCISGSTGLTEYDAFTHPNNFGTTTSATNTSMWTRGLYFSSSTAGASQLPYASTTAITTGNIFATIVNAITSLFVPTTTALPAGTANQIAVNTTAASSSLQFGGNALYATTSVSFTYSTTTPSTAATDTVPIVLGPRGSKFTSLGCKTLGGTANVQIGNGTASSSMEISSTGIVTPITLSTNNAFDSFGTLYVAIGTYSANTVSYVSCGLGREYTY